MGFFSILFGKKKKQVKETATQVKNQSAPTEEVAEAPATFVEEPTKIQETEKTPAKKPVANKKKITDTKVQKPAAESSDNKSEEPPKTTEKTGFFRIKKSKDDRYVFNLYASNKVIVATSQIYSSASSAINGINSVKNNAEIAQIEDQTLKNYTPVPFPKWEIYQDKGGDYRFRLSASNGSCICHSQGYTSKANCKNGIQSIIRTAKDAEIDKAYLTK